MDTIITKKEMLEGLKLAESALELCRQYMRDKGDLSLWNKLAAPNVIKQIIKKATE